MTIFPWNTSIEEIDKVKPDGIFLSNGPGSDLCRAGYRAGEKPTGEISNLWNLPWSSDHFPCLWGQEPIS